VALAGADRARSAQRAASRNLQALDIRISSLEAFVEKYYWAVGSGLVGAIFIYLLYKDMRLHLWLDEIFTLYMVRLGSVSEIIDATRNGVDLTPPLYNVLAHLLLPIAPESLAIRLPATIGFSAMGVGLLWFLHHRLPALCAFVAVLLAYQLAFPYGTEGRPYGLICGIAALSLACWRQAAEGRNRLLSVSLLALFSGAMAALHYFTVFFAACLLLAELVRWRGSGKFDTAVWLAVLAPIALVLALYYPFIVAARQKTVHFWGTAHLGFMIELYATPAAALLVAFLGAAFLPAAGSRRAPVAMPAHELAAIVAIAIVPVVLIVLFKVLALGFVLRYVLWSVVGISALTAFLLNFFGQGRPLLAAVVLAGLAAYVGVVEARSMARIDELRTTQPDMVALSKLPPSDEPILVTSPVASVELWFYASPELRTRLIYPDCPELDLKYLGYNAGTIGLEGLARISPLKLERCEAVLSNRKPFKLVVGNEKGDDYLVRVLASQGRAVTPDQVGDKIIFDVGAAN
jgi:hypothetical protein